MKSSTNGTTPSVSHSEDLSKPKPSTKTVSQTVTELPTATSVNRSSSNVTPSHSKDVYEKEPPTEQIITTRTTAVVDTVLNEVGIISKNEQSIGRLPDLGKEGESTKILRQNITQLPTTTTTIQSTNVFPTVLKESASFSQRQNTQFVFYSFGLIDFFISSIEHHLIIIEPIGQSNQPSLPLIHKVKSILHIDHSHCKCSSTGVSDLGGLITVNKSTSEVSAASSVKSTTSGKISMT